MRRKITREQTRGGNRIMSTLEYIEGLGRYMNLLHITSSSCRSQFFQTVRFGQWKMRKGVTSVRAWLRKLPSHVATHVVAIMCAKILLLWIYNAQQWICFTC